MKILLGVFLALAGLGIVQGEERSILYLRSSESQTLDPGLTQDKYSSEVIANVFEGLVRFRRDTLELEPCLADRWEMKEGGRKWLFHLRPGVRFHNGDPLNAATVVDCLLRRMRQRESVYVKWLLLFSVVKDIRAVGSDQVEFTLYHPFAPFLNYLTDSCAMIVPPAAYQGGEFNPIGSGPFVFSSWTRGKSLILTRNPGYWGPHSTLEKIVFAAQQNPMWRILQIKNGVADIITLQSEKEYEELLGRNDILKLPLHSFSTYALSFNCRKKVFDRADVRRAFTHLLDKPVLVRQIFQEFAVPAVTLLPKQLFGFNDRLPEPGFDIEKARQLLAKAGLAGGFACKVFFADGNPGVEELINRLVLNARQVKVRITKVRLPFRRLQEAANRGEHDLLCVGWTGTPDPDYYLMPLLTLGKGNSNRSFYQNPELDAILRRARETIDPGKRKALYFRAQEIVYREVPLIPLFHLREIVATQPHIRNVFIDPADHLIFREAIKEGSGK